MNYRQKSKVFGKWRYIRQYGNAAIYAQCHNCGYTYPCYYTDPKNHFAITPKEPYKYCPDCGLKMSLYNGKVAYMVNDDRIIVKIRDYSLGIENSSWEEI